MISYLIKLNTKTLNYGLLHYIIIIIITVTKIKSSYLVKLVSEFPDSWAFGTFEFNDNSTFPMGKLKQREQFFTA